MSTQTKWTMWTYKGFYVFRACWNASGIRWYCMTDDGRLRSDTKQGMRQLINAKLEGGTR